MEVQLNNQVQQEEGDLSKLDDAEIIQQVQVVRENPMLNTVVLSTIFSLLRVRELKICRLVCSTWKMTASSFLERGSVVNLSFRSAKSSLVSKLNMKYLTKFYQYLISKHRTEPSVNFKNLHIVNWDYGSKTWQNFSQNFANSLTTLSLDGLCAQECYLVLHTVFYDFPNLSHLRVACHQSWSWKIHAISKIPDDPLPLKLKSFTFIQDCSQNCDLDWKLFWKLFPHVQILYVHETLPHLRECLDELYQLKPHHQLQQLTLIESAVSDTENTNRLQFLIKNIITSSGQQLTELRLDLNFMAEQWRDVLIGASEHLKSLSVTTDWALRGHEVYLTPPTNKCLCDYFLQTLLTSQLKSQHLTHINLHFINKIHRSWWSSLMVVLPVESTLKFPSVTSLSWVFSPRHSWSVAANYMQSAFPCLSWNFAKIFPNLKKLEMTIQNRRHFRNIVIHLTALEELIISELSPAKLEDSDIIGDSKPSYRRYQGIGKMSELRNVVLKGNNSRLTGESMFQGFFKLEHLVQLQIRQTKGAPRFDDIVMYKLREKQCKLILGPLE